MNVVSLDNGNEAKIPSHLAPSESMTHYPSTPLAPVLNLYVLCSILHSPLCTLQSPIRKPQSVIRNKLYQ